MAIALSSQEVQAHIHANIGLLHATNKL
jgi:hypothetical protein